MYTNKRLLVYEADPLYEVKPVPAWAKAEHLEATLPLTTLWRYPTGAVSAAHRLRNVFRSK